MSPYSHLKNKHNVPDISAAANKPIPASRINQDKIEKIRSDFSSTDMDDADTLAPKTFSGQMLSQFSTATPDEGSVLGPILFSLYTAQLGKIIDKYSIDRHHFADDSQLYSRMQPNPAVAQAALRNLQACSAEIKRWMLTNKLKLNDDKSEALLCGTKPSRSKLQISSVHVGDAEIPLSESSRLSIPGFHDNTTKKRFGARSFKCSAPALWNALPPSLKSSTSTESFRSHLKTYLFSKF
nr:hypothetical protein BaRGS_011168 [Batillaria attramentaria]